MSRKPRVISDEEKMLANLSMMIRVTFEFPGGVQRMSTPEGFRKLCLGAGMPDDAEKMAAYFRQNQVDWPYHHTDPLPRKEYMASMNKRAIELLTGK